MQGRLWARAESRVEHLVHTARAVLLAPTIWALYLAGRSGLYIAIVLVGLDVIATALDVLVEPESRKEIGGVPRTELALHIAATVFHVGAIGLAFVAAVSGSPPLRPDLVALVANSMVVVSLGAAVHHIALAVCGMLPLRRLQETQVP